MMANAMSSSTAKLIALEGIDGSGKGTQSRLLVERLRATGKRIELISFPRYDATTFGQAIGDFLNGRFGSLEQVHPFLASVLYAADRYESRDIIDAACSEADVVVFDRFVASNLAHQGSRLPVDERAEFVKRVQTIEHGVFGLPQTDLTILFHIPADEARKLVAKKDARSYTEREADIQEEDTDYLGGVSDVYQSLADAGDSWRRIDCLNKDGLRSVESISDEVWQHAEKLVL